MGELRGLSKWRARYQSIGLDKALIDNATEKAGTFLVQVERFMSVLSSAVQQVCSFAVYFSYYSLLLGRSCNPFRVTPHTPPPKKNKNKKKTTVFHFLWKSLFTLSIVLYLYMFSLLIVVLFVAFLSVFAVNILFIFTY